MNRDELRNILRPAIVSQLDEMTAFNHCGAGSVVKAVGRSELRARMASVDRLACEVELISVTSPRMSSLDSQQLNRLAEELADQLSYLEERLVVLEIDKLVPSVQIRSDTPRVEDDTRSYFEVQVVKSGITLQRFEKSPTTRRTAVPSALTHGVFIRACVDLMACIDEIG